MKLKVKKACFDFILDFLNTHGVSKNIDLKIQLKELFGNQLSINEINKISKQAYLTYKYNRVNTSRKVQLSHVELTELQQKLIEHLKTNLSISSISNDLGVHKATVYRQLNKLVEKKIVFKISKGNINEYQLNSDFKNMRLILSKNHEKMRLENATPKISKTKSPKSNSNLKSELDFNNLSSSSNKGKGEIPPLLIKKIELVLERIIRLHKNSYLTDIIQAPPDIQNRLDNDSLFDIVNMTGWRYHKGEKSIKGILAKIQIKINVVIIHLPNVYGSNPLELENVATTQLLEVKAWIEDRYNILLSPNFKHFRSIKTKGQHQAILNHYIAVISKELGFSYKSDNMEIDSSKGIPELEFINDKFTVNHIISFIMDEEDKIQNNYYWRDLKRDFFNLIEEFGKATKETNNLSHTVVRISSFLSELNQSYNETLIVIKTILENENKELRKEVLDLKIKVDSVFRKKSRLTRLINFFARKKLSEEK